MVKQGFAIILLFLFSCSLSDSNNKITEQDTLGYADYIEYLKIVRSGQKVVLNNFGADKNYKYYYKDFKELDMKALIFTNLLLNQQYIVVYSDFLKNNSPSYKAQSAIRAINLKTPINQDVIKAYVILEEFLEPKLEKNIKKIFIGNEVGGAALNMMALSLITNSGFRKDEIEVVSFGTPPFFEGRAFDINSTFINLDTDETVKLSTRCCGTPRGNKILNLKYNAKLKQPDKLLAYQTTLKSL